MSFRPTRIVVLTSLWRCLPTALKLQFLRGSLRFWTKSYLSSDKRQA